MNTWSRSLLNALQDLQDLMTLHLSLLVLDCAGLCWQDEGFFDFERIDEKALPIMSLKSSARCVIMSYFYVSSNDYMSSIGIYARCE